MILGLVWLLFYLVFVVFLSFGYVMVPLMDYAFDILNLKRLQLNFFHQTFGDHDGGCVPVNIQMNGRQTWV